MRESEIIAGRTIAEWDAELASKKPSARLAALAALGAHAAAVPLLEKALKDERGPVRVAAVEALTALGKAARPAVPKLLELYRDKHARHHLHTAVRAIGWTPAMLA